jgi:hypothetical protein
MQKIKQLSAILLVMILFDLLYFELRLSNPMKEVAMANQAYQLLMLFLTFLFLLTLLYRSVFSMKSSPWLIACCLLLCFMLSVFVSGRLKSLMLAYERAFTHWGNTNVDPQLHRFDDQGLWRGNPRSKGYYHYNVGDTLLGKVEVIFDSLGHKSVDDSLRVKSDTLDMIVGCSFSFGQFVKGEEGYPYLVTKKLDHRFMNASMGGYGLAQMQMRLDSLLPAHRFRYVFIQMSPWLSERAMSISGMFARGYPSGHYFGETDSGIVLMPQAYKSPDYKVLGEWNARGKSYIQRIRYFLTDGYDLQVKGYVNMRIAKLKTSVGLLTAPVKDTLALEKFFYDKAISDVRKAGAIPVLVKFFWKERDFESLGGHLKGKALIVDCDRRLDSVSEAMGVRPNDLYRLYVERGGRKIVYDNHPNEFANRLIAEEILSRIGEAR